MRHGTKRLCRDIASSLLKERDNIRKSIYGSYDWNGGGDMKRGGCVFIENDQVVLGPLSMTPWLLRFGWGINHFGYARPPGHHG